MAPFLKMFRTPNVSHITWTSIVKKTTTDLHVQNLLESLRISISQELDVVINKHHWWFMWGHHHLWKRRV